METFRPEYLEAVAASRWNVWLIPLFLSAPLLLLVAVLRRWHWAVITGLALVGAVATWFSVFAYSETIWKTMEANAQTAAEMEDVASDTARVFGPFLLGIPFAVFYTLIWLGISLVIRVISKRVRRAQRLEPPRVASLIIAATLALAAGCSRAPVITIRNQSPLTISNVVVSGSGFTNRITSIPAGAEHRLTVRPSGESGVRLVFDAGARHIDSGSQGFFEAGGGYRMTATTGTNLSVSVSEKLGLR